MNDLRSLLDDLADQSPAVGDIDRAIADVARENHRRRTGLVAVAAAVSLLVAVAGLAWNARHTQPEPSGPQERYEGVILRGTALMAVDPSGRERTLVDLAGRFTQQQLGHMGVTPGGWLQQEHPPGGSDLFDLSRPGSPPVPIPAQTAISWNTDGSKIALLAKDGHVSVLDPLTRDEQPLKLHGATAGGTSFVWTQDGSGILVRRPQPHQTGQPRYAVAPLDGGPLVNGVPALAVDEYERWIAEGGTTIVCTHRCAHFSPFPSRVRIRSPDGTVHTIYDAEQDVYGENLSADGTSVYVARGDCPVTAVQTGCSIQVINAALDRSPSVVATFNVDADFYLSQFTYLASAPDDSAMAVAVPVRHSGLTLVAPTDGSPPRQYQGRFLGWIPTTTADAIAEAN
jgi:hypothetical protein